MYVIHRVLRASFGRAPALIAEAGDDPARHDLLDAHIAEMTGALHRHHHGEDLTLWDRMAEHRPACALHVEQMRAQHTDIAEGECGAAAESTIVKPKPALAVTGSAGWMALAATGGALALGGVMLLALRQRRKTFALAGAVRSCGDEVASE